MIKFNELNISKDNKSLIIDVSVLNESYYDSVYIDEIIVDTKDTFTNNSPSDKYIYKKTIEGNYKSISLTLNESDIPMIADGILFIWVKTKGTVAPNVPCGKDNINNLGVAVNMFSVYNQSSSYLKELEDNCQIPKYFIDYILRVKAFQLSLETGNYIQAIELWNSFFKVKHNVSNNCNCGYGNII